MKTIFQNLEGKIDDFKGKMCEEFLCVQVRKENNILSPGVFWIKFSEDPDWYRFFIDAFILHWDAYKDMSDDRHDETDFPIFDIGKEYNLIGLNINRIEMTQNRLSDEEDACLTIEFSGHRTFTLAYTDKKTMMSIDPEKLNN